ncbi:MAG: hypothetical protein QOC70_2597 [Verrucomicrobiota bacterium]|jgi:hypothetical protein
MRLLWRRRFVHEPDHELIWLAVSVASVSTGTAWLALALPWPRCPFLEVTGLPCVTCGATRSTIALLHGDFLSALRWNPLAFLAFCGVAAFDLYATIVLVARTPRLRIIGLSVVEKNAARIAVISLLALNWIYLLAHRDRF